MIDFIGDIHGYADKLMELLEKLGYSAKMGVYSHPTRKVLFVGDYIDRGPRIRETLSIVRQMVESGNAIALMGNHEYNALCFHYEEREGGHLRKHLIKNILQHVETLTQFKNRQDEYNDYLEWFKTLPLYFMDKDATERNEIRIKWWLDPRQASYREMSVIPIESLPEEAFDLSMMHSTSYYSETEKPVFFGHYWMSGPPELIRENICCLDYSVARHGILVAYRFDGERELSNDRFVYV